MKVDLLFGYLIQPQSGYYRPVQLLELMVLQEFLLRHPTDPYRLLLQEIPVKVPARNGIKFIFSIFIPASR